MNPVWEDIRRIREQVPLVHNITNYVVMNCTANALLALGASPVMAHAGEEVEEMAGLARALVINIGTLSAGWVEAMVRAGREATRQSIPVVLDPVGCGATRYRTATAQELMEKVCPTIVRGNASEIRALAHSRKGTKGVDSTHAPEEAIEDAKALALARACVVVVSGAVDLIVEGQSVVRIRNGHPIMSRVTGMGCVATALVGAFAAVNPSPLRAAAHAMAATGLAGEIAAERSSGPGSFLPHFMDALYNLEEADVVRRVRMEEK